MKIVQLYAYNENNSFVITPKEIEGAIPHAYRLIADDKKELYFNGVNQHIQVIDTPILEGWEEIDKTET